MEENSLSLSDRLIKEYRESEKSNKEMSMQEIWHHALGKSAMLYERQFERHPLLKSGETVEGKLDEVHQSIEFLYDKVKNYRYPSGDYRYKNENSRAKLPSLEKMKQNIMEDTLLYYKEMKIYNESYRWAREMFNTINKDFHKNYPSESLVLPIWNDAIKEIKNNILDKYEFSRPDDTDDEYLDYEHAEQKALSIIGNMYDGKGTHDLNKAFIERILRKPFTDFTETNKKTISNIKTTYNEVKEVYDKLLEKSKKEVKEETTAKMVDINSSQQKAQPIPSPQATKKEEIQDKASKQSVIDPYEALEIVNYKRINDNFHRLTYSDRTGMTYSFSPSEKYRRDICKYGDLGCKEAQAAMISAAKQHYAVVLETREKTMSKGK